MRKVWVTSIAGAALLFATATTLKTQVVVDDDADSVRIISEGRTIVTINSTGMHVEGDITHTGTVADVPSPLETGRTP